MNPYVAGPLFPHSNLAGSRCRDCQRGKLRFQARAHSRIRSVWRSRDHRRKTTASGIPANAIRNLPGGLAARENWQMLGRSTSRLCLMFRLIARALVAVQTEPSSTLSTGIRNSDVAYNCSAGEQRRRNIKAIASSAPCCLIS